MEIACQTSDTVFSLPRVLSQSEFSLLCLAALTSTFQKLSGKINICSFYDCITGMLSEENACPEQGIELPKKVYLCNQGTRDLWLFSALLTRLGWKQWKNCYIQMDSLNALKANIWPSERFDKNLLWRQRGEGKQIANCKVSAYYLDELKPQEDIGCHCKSPVLHFTPQQGLGLSHSRIFTVRYGQFLWKINMTQPYTSQFYCIVNQL